MRPAPEFSDALKQQIAAEMGKPTKDYNQLKQLKSQLQAREDSRNRKLYRPPTRKSFSSP